MVPRLSVVVFLLSFPSLVPKKILHFLSTVRWSLVATFLCILIAYIGFARNSYWEYLGLIADNDEVTVRFGNTSNAELTLERYIH